MHCLLLFDCLFAFEYSSNGFVDRWSFFSFSIHQMSSEILFCHYRTVCWRRRCWQQLLLLLPLLLMMIMLMPMHRYAIDFLNSSFIFYFHLKKFYDCQGNSKYQTQISWAQLETNNELSIRSLYFLLISLHKFNHFCLGLHCLKLSIQSNECTFLDL